MKILRIIKSAPFYLLFITLFVITMSGCWRGDSYKIESPKVSNPEEVSTACAKSQGLSEQDAFWLERLLKKNDSKYNDEFKLRAMAVIAESDNVAPEDRNITLKNYLACIEKTLPTDK
jgi:hypothetical protein